MRSIQDVLPSIPKDLARLASLREKFATYVDATYSGHPKRLTYKGKSYIFRRLLEDLIRKRLNIDVPHIETKFIEDHLTEEYAGTSDAYRRKILTSISLFFENQIYNDLLARNPCDQIKRYKKPKYVPRPFTRKQLADLLAQPNLRTRGGRRDRLLMKTALVCGLRWSEVSGLRWNCVDLDPHSRSPTLKVTGKRGAERVIPLERETAKQLHKFLASHEKIPPSTAFVFAGDKNPQKPICEDSFRQAFQSYCLAAGINEDTKFHRLRHSAATWLLSKGMPLFLLARFLGHRWIQSTMTYAKVDETKVVAEYFRCHPKADLAEVQKFLDEERA